MALPFVVVVGCLYIMQNKRKQWTKIISSEYQFFQFINGFHSNLRKFRISFIPNSVRNLLHTIDVLQPPIDICVIRRFIRIASDACASNVSYRIHVVLQVAARCCRCIRILFGRECGTANNDDERTRFYRTAESFSIHILAPPTICGQQSTCEWC